jgi:hypothetical protein
LLSFTLKQSLTTVNHLLSAGEAHINNIYNLTKKVSRFPFKILLEKNDFMIVILSKRLYSILEMLKIFDNLNKEPFELMTLGYKTRSNLWTYP